MKVESTSKSKVQEQTREFESNESSDPAAIPTWDPTLTEIYDSSARKANDAQIRELAYRLYEDRGRVDGRELDDWLEAESIIRQEGKLAS